MLLQVSVLDDRLQGLSVSLESASVEKSRQHELVNKMKKELNETKDFIKVRSLSLSMFFMHQGCKHIEHAWSLISSVL